MKGENSISQVTRREIIDYFLALGISWSGRLQKDEFLRRLYDLSTMPSTDHRLRDAAGDIRQHRFYFNDWADDWVLTDPRFNLLYAPDKKFLQFLCETVHPVVRPNSDEVQTLVIFFNQKLKADGWSIVEVNRISGNPRFGYRPINRRVTVSEEPTGWQKVDRQVQEIRLSLDTAETEEQFQVVGLLCREALISLAQEVFDPHKHKSTDGVDPSPTDAKRMLEAFLKTELIGPSNNETRANARAALHLALALQHKRTADFRTAAMCAEGTFSVINLIAILGGRGRAKGSKHKAQLSGVFLCASQWVTTGSHVP